jgi:PII-like signaling protein
MWFAWCAAQKLWRSLVQQTRTAEILRIHISESDRYQSRPLYEAIVAKCREMRIAGATVFLGLEGYGETAEMHRAHLVRSDRPVVITIVDTPENIGRLIPIAEEMMDTGLIAVSQVSMIRVRQGTAVEDGSAV